MFCYPFFETNTIQCQLLTAHLHVIIISLVQGTECQVQLLTAHLQVIVTPYPHATGLSCFSEKWVL